MQISGLVSAYEYQEVFWIMFDNCRLKKFTILHKMIYWQRIWWYLTPMLKFLCGLVSQLTPKKSRQLLTLARYSMANIWLNSVYFCGISLFTHSFAELHTIGWFIRRAFSEDPSVQNHWRKWTMLLHDLLLLGASQRNCKCTFTSYNAWTCIYV